MTSPFFQPHSFYPLIWIGISTIPAILWIAIFSKEDGRALGLVGYLIVKWLRRLK